MAADNTIVLTTTTITVKLHADNGSFCLLLGIFVQIIIMHGTLTQRLCVN